MTPRDRRKVKLPGLGYTVTEILTDYYCPRCGAQKMWQQEGANDYYLGTTTTCDECAHVTQGLDVVRDAGPRP